MARALSVFVFAGLLGSLVRVHADESWAHGYDPPRGATTVEIVSPHAPIFSAPREGATRRGTLAFRSRHRFLGRVAGTGCERGAYVDLGEQRFTCEEWVTYSAAPPTGHAEPRVRPGELLPHRVAFVRYDATPSYARPEDYFVGDFGDTYGIGFGLVVVEQRVVDGIGFLRLRRGGFITDDAVRFATGSDFAGVTLSPGEPVDLAWVRDREVAIRSRPRGRVVRRAGRREQVHVSAVVGDHARLADGNVVPLAALNRVVVVPRPAGVAADERWIDVSIAEQVLVAYEGDTPVFATLVSTGSDRPGSRTPIGTFPVWAKLATSDMDDLERTDVRDNYLIEGVPWVQYFEGGNALHAAFWHDDFGRARSHGCVNLSPADARFLYGFTRPVVPDGYEAVVPLAGEPRTVVNVRP